MEVIFAYPGIGYRLYQAIQAKDVFVIQGIVLLLSVSIAVATFAAGPGLSAHRPAHPRRPHVTGFLARAMRARLLLAGIALLALLALVGVLGPLMVDPHLAEIGATMPRRAPDGAHLARHRHAGPRRARGAGARRCRRR